VNPARACAEASYLTKPPAGFCPPWRKKARKKKPDFFTRMVEVYKKSHFNSIFKANILDFSGFGNKIRKKIRQFIVIIGRF
jgi:hypothetical protein